MAVLLDYRDSSARPSPTGGVGREPAFAEGLVRTANELDNLADTPGRSDALGVLASFAWR